jgi:hypothetical protein
LTQNTVLVSESARNVITTSQIRVEKYTLASLVGILYKRFSRKG